MSTSEFPLGVWGFWITFVPMKNLPFIFILLAFAGIKTAKAQLAPGIEWAKCLGGTSYDYAYSTQQTSDGGYIVAGNSFSNNQQVSGNHGDNDYWIVKLDNLGTIQWQKCLGGTFDEYAKSIQQTSDDGYIIAGYAVSNDGDVSGHHGNGMNDYWVVKTDNMGNIQWQKSLGGIDDDFAQSVDQCSDGGYIVAGFTESNDGDVSGNHGIYDYWVVKLNGNGIIQWQKCFGGLGYDKAYSVQQTFDNGFIVAGNNEDDDYWIIKLDSLGSIQWEKPLGGSYSDFAYSIQQTIDEGYIIAGATYSNNGDVSGNHGNNDYWIVKIDSVGTIQWQKCLGGGNDDYAYSIRQTNDGGFVVGGATHSNGGNVSGNHGNLDCWIVKLDSLGIINWQKCMGGSNTDYSTCVNLTSDGGYISAGYTTSNNGDVNGYHANWDYWIVKLFSDTITSVPIINHNSSAINIYPNPAEEFVVVSYESGGEIIITDVLGKEMYRNNLTTHNTPHTTQIDIRQFPSGIYFVKAGDEVRKFVKK